jgi:hypothetical protein
MGKNEKIMSYYTGSGASVHVKNADHHLAHANHHFALCIAL